MPGFFPMFLHSDYATKNSLSKDSRVFQSLRIDRIPFQEGPEVGRVESMMKSFC